jgi:hypothetical protein
MFYCVERYNMWFVSNMISILLSDKVFFNSKELTYIFCCKSVIGLFSFSAVKLDLCQNPVIYILFVEMFELYWWSVKPILIKSNLAKICNV